MPEFVVADVGPGGKVEVDGGDNEGGGGVAGGALQQPIRGCDFHIQNTIKTLC